MMNEPELPFLTQGRDETTSSTESARTVASPQCSNDNTTINSTCTLQRSNAVMGRYSRPVARTKRFQLLKLPPEIRLIIYEFAFQHTYHMTFDRDINVSHWINYPEHGATSLLRTCKKVRKEAQDFQWSQASLLISVGPKEDPNQVHRRSYEQHSRFAPAKNLSLLKYVRTVQVEARRPNWIVIKKGLEMITNEMSADQGQKTIELLDWRGIPKMVQFDPPAHQMIKDWAQVLTEKLACLENESGIRRRRPCDPRPQSVRQRAEPLESVKEKSSEHALGKGHGRRTVYMMSPLPESKVQSIKTPDRS
ncbi:hypothetical protein LTR97_012837 [Elasticomyces elasticus]|uniref:2EXR domain-containing protein n=1 Tax=Elasticomyces elasticus TaxID=574655 RepID=A0AAN7VX25_9PEZI|nr:hypothetical protein LTR97_012837 [Elasticomyces elasticus]